MRRNESGIVAISLAHKNSNYFNKKPPMKNRGKQLEKHKPIVLGGFMGTKICQSHQPGSHRISVGFLPVEKCIDRADLGIIIFVCLYLVVTVEIFYHVGG